METHTYHVFRAPYVGFACLTLSVVLSATTWGATAWWIESDLSCADSVCTPGLLFFYVLVWQAMLILATAFIGNTKTQDEWREFFVNMRMLATALVLIYMPILVLGTAEKPISTDIYAMFPIIAYFPLALAYCTAIAVGKFH